MAATVLLSSLKPGALFRTADGKLWQLLPHAPGDTTPPFYARELLSVEANFRSFRADTPVTPIDIDALERRAQDAEAILHDYCTNGESSYSAGFLHGFDEGKATAAAGTERLAKIMEGRTNERQDGAWIALTRAVAAIRAGRPAAAHAPPYRRLLERCREYVERGDDAWSYADSKALLADIDAALAGKE
jgi:hypothetical protein